MIKRRVSRRKWYRTHSSQYTEDKHDPGIAISFLQRGRFINLPIQGAVGWTRNGGVEQVWQDGLAIYDESSTLSQIRKDDAWENQQAEG